MCSCSCDSAALCCVSAALCCDSSAHFSNSKCLQLNMALLYSMLALYLKSSLTNLLLCFHFYSATQMFWSIAQNVEHFKREIVDWLFIDTTWFHLSIVWALDPLLVCSCEILKSSISNVFCSSPILIFLCSSLGRGWHPLHFSKAVTLSKWSSRGY